VSKNPKHQKPNSEEIPAAKDGELAFSFPFLVFGRSDAFTLYV
jgi:hypothetical protein